MTNFLLLSLMLFGAVFVGIIAHEAVHIFQFGFGNVQRACINFGDAQNFAFVQGTAEAAFIGFERMDLETPAYIIQVIVTAGLALLGGQSLAIMEDE